MKYRKKPVEVEAIQWTGINLQSMNEFMSGKFVFGSPEDVNQLVIFTLEGDHYANVNDYIIKGIKGEFYPCKPDIFELTYEKVEE